MNDYYSKRIPRKPNERNKFRKNALTWFTQHYGSPDCIKYDDNNEPELSSIPYYVEYFYAVRGAYPDKALKAAANDFINNVYKNDMFISLDEINLIICLHASIDSTNAIVELAKTYHLINSQYDYPNKFINMLCNGLDTIMSENANANDKGAYASKAISSITDTLNCFNALLSTGVINCAQFMNNIDEFDIFPFHGYETILMSACEHYKNCDCSESDVSDNRLVNIISRLTASIDQSLPYSHCLNAHAFLSYVIKHSSMYAEPLQYHIILEAFKIISILYDNGLIPRYDSYSNYGAYNMNISPLLYAVKVIMHGYPSEYAVQVALLEYDTNWIVKELFC